MAHQLCVTTAGRVWLPHALQPILSLPLCVFPAIPRCNPQEIESVADGSNKEADKFRALLRSDPFYYSVGRAMRSHHAAVAAQGERAKQQREQLQQQGEAESFRQIGERVEKEVERLVASHSERESEALAEAAAAPVPPAAGPPKAASPASMVKPPRPPSPRKLVAPAPPPPPAAALETSQKHPAPPPTAARAPEAARARGGLAAVGAVGENVSAGSQAVQYGQLQQRDPAIFHAVTTLDRAISFMRARAAAQRQAATAAAGSGAAALPGLVPPKQEVWSYSGQLRPAPRKGESRGDGDAGETGGIGEGGTEERVWILTRAISAGPADHARGVAAVCLDGFWTLLDRFFPRGVEMPEIDGLVRGHWAHPHKYEAGVNGGNTQKTGAQTGYWCCTNGGCGCWYEGEVLKHAMDGYLAKPIDKEQF
ncbi:unnamed protein product [Closterium sp. Yama58-4]|nr:unnamed protein product [Closterium sp. Yama58-4]